MTGYKTDINKKALVIAIVVIFLCLVSLSGATYALFINSDDGTIGIVTTSGTVDVDIEDKAGNSLVNETLSFVVKQGLSNDVLFEPGATFFTQDFTIKNEGTVPVNFTLSVSRDEKIDMEKFNQAFEIWIVKKGDAESSALKISEFIERGLRPGASSATYCLYIKMKETAGNEFQKKTYTGIGITVYAVQSNANIGE